MTVASFSNLSLPPACVNLDSVGFCKLSVDYLLVLRLVEDPGSRSTFSYCASGPRNPRCSYGSTISGREINLFSVFRIEASFCHSDSRRNFIGA